jgi:hypothetical protein
VGSFVLLKSEDESVTDFKSMVMKMQELNPNLMKSRARDIVAAKHFFQRNDMFYVRPRTRRVPARRTAV